MNIELKEDQRIRVWNSGSVFKVMREILLREDEIDLDKEHFWDIGLAANSMLIYVELVSLGSHSMAAVEPMEVFRVAILKGAVKMILCHNHTGLNLTALDLQPTELDNDLTDRMIQVGKIVNIEVIDHLIISTDQYYSYQQSGLLQELELSKKWVPRYKEEERIRKEALKLGEQRGLKQGKRIGLEKGLERGVKKGEKIGLQKGKIEIAQKMREEGLPVEKISDYTGLTKREIEKL
jgi:DNA repair protein RadC